MGVFEFWSIDDFCKSVGLRVWRLRMSERIARAYLIRAAHWSLLCLFLQPCFVFFQLP
jgi:hypothetical protein